MCVLFGGRVDDIQFINGCVLMKVFSLFCVLARIGKNDYGPFSFFLSFRVWLINKIILLQRRLCIGVLCLEYSVGAVELYDGFM